VYSNAFWAASDGFGGGSMLGVGLTEGFGYARGADVAGFG